MWDTGTVKLALFHPAARAAIQSFPADVRKELGKAIFDLQCGHTLGMPLSRPMYSPAAGAAELRVRGSDGSYRVFYLIQSLRGVLVFHAFVKKTRKTPKRELDLAKRRLKELLHEES